MASWWKTSPKIKNIWNYSRGGLWWPMHVHRKNEQRNFQTVVFTFSLSKNLYFWWNFLPRRNVILTWRTVAKSEMFVMRTVLHLSIHEAIILSGGHPLTSCGQRKSTLPRTSCDVLQVGKWLRVASHNRTFIRDSSVFVLHSDVL